MFRSHLRVSSLYYVMRSRSLTACCHPPAPVSTPPVTTAIDVSGFGKRKLEAMRCYRSQKHMQSEDPAAIREILNGKELFHRVFPISDIEEIEDRFDVDLP